MGGGAEQAEEYQGVLGGGERVPLQCPGFVEHRIDAGKAKQAGVGACGEFGDLVGIEAEVVGTVQVCAGEAR